MLVNLNNILESTHPKKPYSNINSEKAAINNLLVSLGLEVEEVIQGASIIQYRIRMQPETNLKKLIKLESNFKIALNCDNVQVITKGNQCIIQKPCDKSLVVLREFYTKSFLNAEGLKLIMGTDINNNHIYTDLAKQPHMLVAGTTGSGKSMFLHQCIISLLMKNPGIQIHAIDTKQVEFNAYKAIENFHYITDEVAAVQTLKRLCDIMDGRYKTFSAKGYRDITHAKQSGLTIEPIVCIIDEFADLIMKPEYSKVIESYVVRLAQKSRAAGIHLIIATQRPTADVITGLIKANIPSRVCFKVASAMESRIILDAKGGEYLTGHGDMLYKSNGSFEPIRMQSCFISENEMKNIGKAFIKKTEKPVEPEDNLDVAKRHSIERSKKEPFYKRFFK